MMKVLIYLMLMVSVFSAEYNLANSNKIFIPDDIPKEAKLRGVIVIRNYGGMGGLYSKRPKEWQDFLTKEKFAFVLFTPQNGVGKKDSVGISVGRSDIKRLDSVLTEAEKKSGFKNLQGLPFIPIGISRGGANSLAMAAADTKRAIAAIGHHGESGIGLTIKNLPVLYTHAQFEKTKNMRNLKINNWLQSIHGKSGFFYSTVMHKGYRHSSYGDGKLALKWIQSVLRKRIDKNGKVIKMSSQGSWYASYKIEGEKTPSAKFIDCRISEKKSSSAKMWLPDKETAEFWLEKMKAQY